jgi:hypothetical protein
VKIKASKWWHTIKTNKSSWRLFIAFASKALPVDPSLRMTQNDAAINYCDVRRHHHSPDDYIDKKKNPQGDEESSFQQINSKGRHCFG